MDVIKALQEHSEAGQAIVDLLYGDGAVEITKRLTLAQAKAHKDRVQTAMQASVNSLGLAPKRKDNSRVRKSGPQLTLLEKIRVKKSFAEVVEKGVEDIVLTTEISKVDTDKRQIFGWASVTSVNGVEINDLQDDTIPLEEIEKAAYEYVVKSRKGGNMHQKNEFGPVHVSDMIESFVVTPEKRAAMGLPNSVPDGWWTGFKINDDQTWEDAKSGKLAGLSIHGSGRRKEMV